ncbi:membrane protein [Tateyamaria omphalii]|uniref:DMT family transporter n=1 Tax=Tateyamaria omphalii TaxID=299262 RepID=UPI001995C9B2|nr:DMT family transporter [Tateyamaria omphalii]GGX53806.1 membrane protein [Tateyamaria omphalii]
MTTDIATNQRANLLGSLWMVASMAAFAAEDAFVKAASVALPVGQILIIFGLGGVFVFTALALWKGDSLFVPEVVSPPMLVRVIFEITGRLFYVLAISLTALSSTTVILQATPLVVVAGAALLFGERVGWRRWAAILIGLVGVVVIIQPGTNSFSAMSILALVGMIGFAGRDLASRAAPASLSTNILGVYGFLSVLFAGLIVSVWQDKAFVQPNAGVSLALLGAILAGAVAYASLMKAMRTGEVSAVTPFRYTRLLFGVGLGVTVFGEQLSASMLVGTCLIVLSGLFILWRGKQAADI